MFRKSTISQARTKNIVLFHFIEPLRKIEDVRATDITATTVTINWSKPAQLTYVEYYEIQLNTGDESQIYQTSNSETIEHITIDNLSPGVVYYCRVRALIRFNGNVYKGDWSNQIYFTAILRKIPFVDSYRKKILKNHLICYFLSLNI